MRFPRVRIPRLSRKLLVVPPVALGIAVLALAVSRRQSPQQEPIEELARVLTVATIEQRQIQPHVIGYGLAQPAQISRAVARVAGTVIETHPNLNGGILVPKGAVLVRIDPTDYELQVGQLTAEADALRAQTAEVEASRENDQATLELEEQLLVLFQNEIERQRRLHKQNATSTSAVEQTERELLRQRRSAQALRNSLNLVPAKLDRLGANLVAVEKQLAAARRDLERTVIKAPLRCRLASVHIECGQYVAVNEKLFEVHGLESIEVEARLPVDDLGKLAPPQTAADESGQEQSIEEFIRGLSATVRVRSGGYLHEWPAELVRIREQVDPRTRTLGVVVEVRHREEIQHAQHPPLLAGTFCEVEFAGGLRSHQLLVPVAAVRNQRLYVVNNERRLERRIVETVLTVGDEVVVQGDLRPGEVVVVGDPSPAVEGMLVKAVEEIRERRIATVPRRKP